MINIVEKICNIKLTLLFVVIYTTQVILVGFMIVTKSPAFNEPEFMSSGVFICRDGNFNVYRVNPPLLKIIAAIVPSLLGAQVPDEDLIDNPTVRNDSQIGYDFILANKRHPFLYFVLARFVALHFLLGLSFLLIYHLSNVLSRPCLFFFVVLFFFSPYFLGNAYILSQDVYAGITSLLSVCSLFNLMQKNNVNNILKAGLYLGIAEVTKFTLIVLYPIFLLIMLIYALKIKRNIFKMKGKKFLNKVMHVLVLYIAVVAISLVVINVCYEFNGTGRALRSYNFKTCLFTGYSNLRGIPYEGANRFNDSCNTLERLLGYIPLPLPKDYIQGIDTQCYDFEAHIPSYMCGKWSDHGSPFFYLYAIILKTPTGTLILFWMSSFFALFKTGYNWGWRQEVFFFLPGIVIFCFVSSQIGFSLHYRYILPSIPFLYLWISKLGSVVYFKASNSKKFLVCLILFLSVWSIVSCFSVYPNDTSYFNQWARIIPNSIRRDIQCKTNKPRLCTTKNMLFDSAPLCGPYHLIDSNIDWGQDLFALERWCKCHPEVNRIKTLVWGKYPVSLTNIPNVGFPSAYPEPGWYAISVNNIYSKDETFRYFLQYQPIKVIGFSIYIYHIQETKKRIKSEPGLWVPPNKP